MLYIYVDGSCLGNQNVDKDTPAGWGVVIIKDSNDLGRGNGDILHEFHGKAADVPPAEKTVLPPQPKGFPASGYSHVEGAR